MSDSLRSHGLHSPQNSLGQNAGVGSLSLLQGVIPTQGSNPGLLYYSWILCQLSHKGSPRILAWAAYPFSSRSSQPRNWTGSPALQADFLPTELSVTALIQRMILFQTKSNHLRCNYRTRFSSYTGWLVWMFIHLSPQICHATIRCGVTKANNLFNKKNWLVSQPSNPGWSFHYLYI